MVPGKDSVMIKPYYIGWGGKGNAVKINSSKTASSADNGIFIAV
jgi:hypothetical protein